MATAGEKLVNDRVRRSRPFFPGRTVEQAARILVNKNPDDFVGISKACACKQVVAALRTKLDRGELVLSIKGRGRAPKVGLRRPTATERERIARKATMSGPKSKQRRRQTRPGHLVTRERREARRLKQGPYAA